VPAWVDGKAEGKIRIVAHCDGDGGGIGLLARLIPRTSSPQSRRPSCVFAESSGGALVFLVQHPEVARLGSLYPADLPSRTPGELHSRLELDGTGVNLDGSPARGPGRPHQARPDRCAARDYTPGPGSSPETCPAGDGVPERRSDRRPGLVRSFRELRMRAAAARMRTEHAGVSSWKARAGQIARQWGGGHDRRCCHVRLFR
jgi:hypothetical protein